MMKCRAYCILPDRENLRSVLPRGPEFVTLDLVTTEGLACVFAPVSGAVPTTAVSHLLGYARVIADLSQHFPLMPMRYGSVLDSEDQLRDLLCKRQVAIRACLQVLEGCDEMSLRILTDPKGAGDDTCPHHTTQPRNGTAYLATRRSNYLAREQIRQEATRLSDDILALFHRLFRTARTEQSIVNGRSLTSLHFLVPRDQIEPFRATFQRLQQTTSHKLLLSGPWPPYHFAVMD